MHFALLAVTHFGAFLEVIRVYLSDGFAVILTSSLPVVEKYWGVVCPKGGTDTVFDHVTTRKRLVFRLEQ